MMKNYCRGCGYQIEGKEKKFCGLECYVLWMKGGKCLECGMESQNIKKNRMFCNVKCFRDFLRRKHGISELAIELRGESSRVYSEYVEEAMKNYLDGWPYDD